MCVMDYVPFSVLKDDKSVWNYAVDTKKIIEYLIQALVIGGIVMYGSQQRIVSELDNVKHSIEALQKNQDKVNDTITALLRARA